MPRQDWTPTPRDAERRARDDRYEDFGQADYSQDYAYDPQRRSGYRADEMYRARGDDYGQADYSADYGLDSASGRAYRRFSEDDRDYGRRLDESDYRRGDDASRDGGRSWRERAGSFFGATPRREEDRRDDRRRGPSDRVLWAIIVERLEDQRGLDLRDVEVLVDNGEVTLNGTVRRKHDKRRIEDIADIDGVRNVQNNLRVRESRGWF